MGFCGLISGAWKMRTCVSSRGATCTLDCMICSRQPHAHCVQQVVQATREHGGDNSGITPSRRCLQHHCAVQSHPLAGSRTPWGQRRGPAGCTLAWRRHLCAPTVAAACKQRKKPQDEHQTTCQRVTQHAALRESETHSHTTPSETQPTRLVNHGHATNMSEHARVHAAGCHGHASSQ